MTLKIAIARLQDLAKKHGEDTEVYFDCPKCQVAFTPTVVVTQAVVLSGAPKP